jgi:hypothetical protein
MTLYMGGRQISKRHMRCIREENNKLNKQVNRIPVMAPISEPIWGVHFFRGHISLKNGSFCPLSSHNSSYFKNMCLLI